MGVERGPLWEIQWFPGGKGKFRRLVLTQKGLRNLVVAVVVLSLLTLGVLGILPLGLRGVFARFTVDSARRENRDLQAESLTLHERSRDLARHVWARLNRARRLAWATAAPEDTWRPTVEPLPASDMPDQPAAWLARASVALGVIGERLAETASAGSAARESAPTGAPVNPAHAVPVALFGWWTSPFTGKRESHHGATLAAPVGEPVLAPGSGKVSYAGSPRERRANEWTRWGTILVLDHGAGVYSVFCHLAAVDVRRGQSVARGQRIASVGRTGWTRVPALYYEVRRPIGGTSRPVDPALYNLGLPLDRLDERFAAPSADLPDDYARLEHLSSAGDSGSAPRARRPRRSPRS